LFQKKSLNGVGKEKKLYAKKWYKKELCRLRPRLLHVVLDVFLIVCLVLRLLNEPFKKSCVVLIIWKHYFGFLLWCFIWVDLAHAHTCLTHTKSP
jgi:hypothetical protein